MMYLQYLALSFLLTISQPTALKENRPAPSENSFRVIGYYLNPGKWNYEEISACLPRLTDLNLAFCHPDSSGNFATYPQVRILSRKAHEKGIRVFASIGGGTAPKQLAGLIRADKRKTFISAIIKFVSEHELDGVDVDLENELINQDYAPFVAELSKALKPSDKLISAAVARWNAHLLADSTLNSYHFLNIMSYDKTGPWRPDRPGQHSPYSMAVSDFDYFHRERGIPSNKLIIGLPFYGYGFGPNAPVSLSFANIVRQFQGAENQDSLAFPEGGMLYYNGQSTIRKKTQFALEQKAGGVMIWQVLGDASAPSNSLLNIIQEQASKNKSQGLQVF